MSHSYPSDISRKQFALVLPILESARRRTKPRTGICMMFSGGAVCLEKRLSVAHAAKRLSQLAHLLQVFPAME